MEQTEKVFSEYKQKLIEHYHSELMLDKLIKDANLNRNFQFQIYLLLELNNQDDELNKLIFELKDKNITIHIFNEFLSNEQIYSLLESNNYKINQAINSINPNDMVLELKQKLDELKQLDEKQNLSKKYKQCFENSKNKKWFKVIRKKALNNATFLAMFTKKRDQKFKLLMIDTINNLNSEFDLKINVENPDYEFIKVYYDYIINWSIKKSLIIVLISLTIIFVIVLTVILVLTNIN